MSIANDRLYRYLVEDGGSIVGAIETTGPVLAGETINCNGIAYTVASVKDSNPTTQDTVLNFTPTGTKRVIILMDRNVGVEGHGYVTYTNTVTRQDEGFGVTGRTKVLVV